MYGSSGGQVPFAVSAGVGGGAAAPLVPTFLLPVIIAIACFAVIMAAGAAWRMIPAAARRDTVGH